MRTIDTTSYSTKKPSRITPEAVNLGQLPPLPQPAPAISPTQNATSYPVFSAEESGGKRGITPPSHHDTTPPQLDSASLEVVRRALREFGKEAATHRFTAEEKDKIADILHAYKKRGLRTSENEIARIAINLIIHDYETRGTESVLDQVIKALNE